MIYIDTSVIGQYWPSDSNKFKSQQYKYICWIYNSKRSREQVYPDIYTVMLLAHNGLLADLLVCVGVGQHTHQNPPGVPKQI